VVKLIDFTGHVHVARELMLIKVHATGDERAEVKRLADIFRGKVIDVTDSTYTIEITGNSEKIDAFVESLSSITIHEVVRSGLIGIGRGDKALF
jgi:acetolactate synthase-1/3 small subunit